VASVEPYKAIAPQETPKPFYPIQVVDGIVIDPKAKFQAGPKAVILPPSNSAANRDQ
jgi:hypothetical protein